MRVHSVRKSVALQISLWVSLLIASITALSILVLNNQTQSALQAQATANLKGVTTSTVNLVETYYLELSDELDRLSRLFAGQYAGQFTLDTNAVVPAGSVSVPSLLINDKVVNGDNTVVDLFAAATEGNATVFVRHGDEFVRVATSVKNENGERAVGTNLNHESPAYTKIQAGESYFGRVKLFGKDFMTKYQPIKNAQGQVIGILYVGIDFTRSLQALHDRIRQIKVGDTGYVYALDARPGKDFGTLAIHPVKEGQNILDSKDENGLEFIKEMLEKKSGILRYQWLNKERNETEPREKIAVYEYAPGFDWVISASSYSDEFNAVGITVRNTMMIVMLGTLLLSFVAIVLQTRRMIGTPLKTVVEHLQQMEGGNYHLEIRNNRHDEIGIVLTALASMQQHVRLAIGRVQADANQLFEAAEVLVNSAQQVSHGSQEQADAASAVAAAIEEMTVSINQVADNAGEARAISVSSGQKGEASSAVIQKTTQSIQEISLTVKDASTKMASVHQQSSEISKVVQVIKEIADQINLLALNAAIEAARAGEQGRGFAVVADEVRKLAERTSQSTAEIVTTIRSMQDAAQMAVASMNTGVTQVDQGVQLAMQTATAISDIKQGSDRVVAAVNDITLAITEQSAASNLVAGQVERIARMSEQNSSAVQKTSSLALQLKELAGHLNNAITHFKL